MQSLFRWCVRVGCSLFVAVLLSACPSQQSPRLPTPPPADIAQPGLDPGNAPEEGTLSDPGRRTERMLLEGPRADGELQDIHFDYDASELSPPARATLQANAGWLHSNPTAKVEIEGHCDNRGTVEYNLALGAERARAAYDYLVSLGIAPERIATISYGEEAPLCAEDSEACWRQNRRVHFLIISR